MRVSGDRMEMKNRFEIELFLAFLIEQRWRTDRGEYYANNDMNDKYFPI